MNDLHVADASGQLPDLAAAARSAGAITYLLDEDGQRVAAVVPVRIADRAEQLRGDAEAADAELSRRS